MSQQKDWQNFPVLVSERQIKETVARLGREISQDYEGKTPLLIGVLKGCFVFMADLVRQLTVPCDVEFIRLSSYGAETKSSGIVEVVSPVREQVQGRDVIIVEDIVDSGLTLSFLLKHLADKGPASVKLCTMFVKGSRDAYPFPIDYMGMEIRNEFVVGYGLDYAEKYRFLKDLRLLEQPITGEEDD